MGQIERISSNTPWEPIFGYSRAVRAGEWLVVSGTTATDERGLIVGAGQMYVQARHALLNLKRHIEHAGLRLDQVVRTRVFVTDISRFAEVARAHKEVMGEFPPASSCVGVTSLVNPDMLVEIEADVYAGSGAAVAPIAQPDLRAAQRPRPVVSKPKMSAKPVSKKAKPARGASKSKPGRKR